VSELKPLRITMLAGEFPYPPIHGGRADTWSRIKALTHIGVRIQLVCWFSPIWGGEPTPEHIRVVQSEVDELIVLPISLGPKALLRRLCLLPWWPSHAASRAPTAPQWADMLTRARQFAPDGIWQDNLWSGVAAERLARTLGIPRWVRSHNIEFRYMNSQRQVANGFSEWLRLWVTCVGLERYELRTLQTADGVFDISVDDMAYWRRRGVTRNHWLPPIVNLPPNEKTTSTNDTPHLAPGGVLYVGNLHTPNNVQGLLWFIEKVWPKVRQLDPTTQVTLAGSNPHPQVTAAIQAAQGVHLMANPSDVWPLYRQARVLINPVLTGSGVNIKTIEMLQMRCPLISTDVGAGGLPAEVRQAIHVANTPEAFAQALHRALHGELTIPADVSEGARQRFQPQVINELVLTLTAQLKSHNGQQYKTR
jgi:glycosyltransferase involved in cell wall biosynthesis